MLNIWFVIWNQLIELRAHMESSGSFGNDFIFEEKESPCATHADLDELRPFTPGHFMFPIDFG